MNLALLLKQPLLKKTLLKQLAYYANGWYVFEDKQATAHKVKNNVTDQYAFKKVDSSKAKVVIVAKTHYRQSWQSYTSISKKELQQILILQKSNENSAATIFQVVSNGAIDGYEVKKTTFDALLLNELGEQRLLIPETDLISLEKEQQDSFTNNQVWLASLETPVGTLFASCFADKSTSSYAKGLIANIEAFKLSSGLPSEITATYINQQSYATFLFSCLTLQKIDQLYRKVAFNAKSWFKIKDLHFLYWLPLLTATAFYLLSNSYLWLQTYNIESELAEQGSEVSQLLNDKYQQDQQSQLLNLLNTEFSKTSTVHQHWAIVYQLVESGMVIERLSFAQNVISIRGQAPNASKVLTEITKDPYVIDASFKGSVLKSRGQESFTLELVSKKVQDLRSSEVKIDKAQAEVKTKETAIP
ncbi:hypothetical protein [Colwellia sp. TT2012]|uniref:hypothetical protein n=1 Tax=Colwellia sp. TT2012 TaxID=1720342 RepID=UPI00070D1B12|nr:hypothetical protein [Colwellia sp. TT2012]